MKQIFIAKTVEDAKELAAKAFGVAKSEIQFEILEEPKRGFLGFGKKGDAKVRATYIPPEPEKSEKTELSFTETIQEKPSKVQDFTEETPEIAEEPQEIIVSEMMSEDAIGVPENELPIMSENAIAETITESEPETEIIPETIAESEPETEPVPEVSETVAESSRSKNATPETVAESEPETELVSEVSETVAESSRSENAISETIAESEPETEPVPEVSEIVAESSMSENAISETVAESEPETEPVPEVSEIVAESSMSENAISETIAESELETEPVPEVSETVAESSMSENATSSKNEKSYMHSDADLITGEPSPSALAKIEAAQNYLRSLFTALDIKVNFRVKAGKDTAMIDIISFENGMVIGKRGENLDALQYLAFMAANRTDNSEYYRIILNASNYRERRRKTLEELAQKIAHRVLSNQRSDILEPMNPYERRIIHSAVAEIDGVESRSVGEEPNRRVVIFPEGVPYKPKYHNNNRRQYNGKPYRKNGNYHKKDSSVQATRISMDSMKTSFEKDYQRPKPEDELNAGLYGKIDI